MIKIFISSHGKLASGFKSAAEILLGDVSRITVFDAYIDERTVESRLDEFYSTLSETDTAILLADIYGGSVANTMAPYSMRDNTYLIAGINCAALLELMMLETATEEKINEIIKQSGESLKRISLDENKDSNIGEDDFF